MTYIDISGSRFDVLEWHVDEENNTIGARVAPTGFDNMPQAENSETPAVLCIPTPPQADNNRHSNSSFDVVFCDQDGFENRSCLPNSQGNSDPASAADIVIVPRSKRKRGSRDPDGVTGGGFGPALNLLNKPQTSGSACNTDDLPSLADGRYAGANAQLSLELRIDFEGSGVVSGDLFGTSFGKDDPLVSFRTAPGVKVSAVEPYPWVVIFERENSAPITGQLVLAQSATDGSVICKLRTEGPVPGLPNGNWFELIAQWHSPFMRRLSIEIEREIATQGPPTYEFNGRTITYQSVLGDAGIDISATGRTDLLEKPANGWGHTQVLTSLLDDAARSYADVPLDEPAWQNQLLWLDQPSRTGLFGIMFDTSAQLPRQGSAVFEGEILQLRPQDATRRMIRTVAHEIGHSLNLVHRFEHEVGRANSLSIMNYDQRYRGGGRSHEYWQDFAYQFDKDELEFLRHGPRHKVIPGGSAFHSVNYWADGTGGYLPYLPQATLSGWDLALTAPTNLYLFGQPVFLQVALTNRTGRTVELDPHILDPKGNFLSVHVRRVDQSPFGSSETMHFHPILERCYDEVVEAFDVIAPNQSLTDNIQITYGAGGFTFAEPGTYDIQVVGSVPDRGNPSNPNDDRQLIVVSKPLRIRVAFPQSVAEEKEVTSILHRPDVGTYIAMGGAYALERAHDDLIEVCNRRLARRKTVSDPIAAAIIRCQGIDIGRRYERQINGTPMTRDGDPEEAVRLLSQVTKRDSSAFDDATRAATQTLIDRHLARAGFGPQIAKIKDQ